MNSYFKIAAAFSETDNNTIDTQEELQLLQDYLEYAWLDKDADGEIEADEIDDRNMFGGMYAYKDTVDTVKEALSYDHSQLDKDGNGIISFDEYQEEKDRLFPLAFIWDEKNLKLATDSEHKWFNDLKYRGNMRQAA